MRETKSNKKAKFTKSNYIGRFFSWLILILASIGLIYSGWKIEVYVLESINNNRDIKALKSYYGDSDKSIEEIYQDKSEPHQGIQEKFNELYKKNPDIKGWIIIPNTLVNLPVYQTDDNDFYIDHDMDKKPSRHGALFLDYRNNIEADNTNQNLTIYGHHMRDGSMLSSIKKYKDINFYRENPYISFNTIHEDGIYKIFAAFITNADPKDDDNYIFNYWAWDFSTEEKFLSWVEHIRRRSLFNSPVEILEEDKILTLSTCTYEIRGTELRFVLIGRKLREDEPLDIDIEGITPNQNPLYPEIWYSKKGGTKPIFEDDLYKWHP